MFMLFLSCYEFGLVLHILWTPHRSALGPLLQGRTFKFHLGGGGVSMLWTD